MEQSNQPATIPPYLSPVTFWNSVDLLRVGVPPKIDRSVFGSQAHLVQSQLMKAFKFLGLIDDHGVSQPTLKELVGLTQDDRGPAIKGMLEASYAFLSKTEFDLSNTTNQALEEEFKLLGASGQTIRKCITFFMTLAGEAGIVISPHVKASKTGGNGAGRRPKAKKSKPENVVVPHVVTPPSKPSGSMRERFLFEKMPAFDPTWDKTATESWVNVASKLLLEEETSE